MKELIMNGGKKASLALIERTVWRFVPVGEPSFWTNLSGAQLALLNSLLMTPPNLRPRPLELVLTD